MSSSGNKNNLSVEVVNDGDMPINVMMQQGMKALSKILSSQLQAPNESYKQSPSMKLRFEKDNNHIGAKRANMIKSDITSKDFPVKDYEQEVIEIGDENNYPTFASDGTLSNSENIIIDQKEFKFDGEIDDPELQLAAEEGDIIFDYGSQEITGTPDKISEHITHMLESVLPNGFQNDTQGRLHAVLNGDELNITEESFVDLHEAMTSLQQVQKIKQRQQKVKHNLEQLNELDRYEKEQKLPSREEQAIRREKEEIGQTRQNMLGGDESCSYPHEYEKKQGEPSKYKQHDYEYPSSKVKAVPNFSVLINEKRPLCLFCEYYMVFGEPPRNMIKWYNRTYEYAGLSRLNAEQHKHHRKGNR